MTSRQVLSSFVDVFCAVSGGCMCPLGVVFLNVFNRLIMPEKDQEMPGELLKVFPANNLQMMFLSGAKGTQVCNIDLHNACCL